MANCLRLKKSNCRNCYKCIRHCPVKSIKFSGDQAHIISDECILCGHCFVVCPQNAKEIVDDTERVKVMLQGDEPVIASIAPSFVADYEGCAIGSMKKALMELGFADAEETALGATMVKREYDRMLEEEDRNIIITSCCHSVNLLIRKYFPECLPYLADVYSPMLMHCLDIKKRYPGAKTVFIGPCVAKKDEADTYPGITDAVLTFEELSEMLKERGIVPEKDMTPDGTGRARFFPTPGGIIKSMDRRAAKYAYLAIDGAENCISALKEIKEGRLDHCFIEMSICAGSCIGGPIMEKYTHNPVSHFTSVARYAGPEDFDIPQPEASELRQVYTAINNKKDYPTESELRDVLRKMGKNKPEDELNCGSCGYNTCREKAVAIYQGKADISMCLPFLKDSAESFSNTIVNNTPNGIVVLNDDMEVQQVNEAALKLFNLKNASDIKGDQVIRILDPSPFIRVSTTKRGIYNEHTYLADYGCYVEQTIVPVENGRMLLCILKDITGTEQAEKEKEELRARTIEAADKVVEKQMRIVQDIASLLGETAAETKVVLTKLKESVSDE